MIDDSPTLFVDFDGALQSSMRTAHKSRDAYVLEQIPYLDTILTAFPTLQIVLAAEWLPALDENSLAATAIAEPLVKARVVGVLSDVSEGADQGRVEDKTKSRYQQIVAYAQVHHLKHWLALDDDSNGWPDEARSHLVRIDREAGLTDPLKRVELHAKLTRLVHQ